MIKDSPDNYGATSQLLHWLSALLVFGLFGLGIYMVELDYYHPWYHQAPALHVSLGLLLLALTALRLLWRGLNGPMAALPGQAPLLRAGAFLMQVALYLCLLTLFLTGYLITTAEGQDASFFDWLYLPATVQLDAEAVDLTGELHEWSAWLLIALAAAHTGAALYHHWARRDRTLVRMLPGK